MATPILELIAQELVSRLGNVSSATSVERPRRGREFEEADHKIVVVQDDPIHNDELSAPGNPPAVAWIQPFLVHLIVRNADVDETPDDQTLNQFKSDVIAAVCTPANSWHQFDGNSINANFTADRAYTPQDANFSGVSLLLEVTYRVDENDPTNAR